MQIPKDRPPLFRAAAGVNPHPAAVILLWLFLAIALQTLHAKALLVAAVPLAAAVLSISAARFLALLRRTRWIMVSLLLIYGYVTPGEALWFQGGALSPSREGLAEGLLQLCRLAAALASLSVVLALLTQQRLFAGLYGLAYPLRFIGLSRERLAVRLALTLHYADAAMLDTVTGWRGGVEHLLAPGEIVQHTVAIPNQPFRASDMMLVAMGGGLWAAAAWW